MPIRQNKKLWIIVGGILFFVLLSAIFGNESETEKSQKAEIEKLNTTIATLQGELETEKEKNDHQDISQTIPDQPSSSEEELFRVAHVVDGDTIKLESGEVVRYIGIDTPETVDPRKPVQCLGKEASQKNKELVEGKEVRLVKDTSETDKYGRLLRYVYIGDTFVNDVLVREGFAHATSYPPDVQYQEEFKQAEQEAKDNKRGLWADGVCDSADAVETETTNTTVTPIPATTSETGGSYVCNCGKTCDQMSSCAEAQYQLNTCGCTRRDADHDGVACDADCQ